MLEKVTLGAQAVVLVALVCAYAYQRITGTGYWVEDEVIVRPLTGLPHSRVPSSSRLRPNQDNDSLGSHA